MSLPAMFFEDRFCISSNGGTGDNVQCAVSMAWLENVFAWYMMVGQFLSCAQMKSNLLWPL